MYIIKFFLITLAVYTLVELMNVFEERELSGNVLIIENACFLRYERVRTARADFDVSGEEKRFFFDEKYFAHSGALQGCYRLEYFLGLFDRPTIVAMTDTESE